MKRNKKLYVLLGVLAVLCVVTLIVMKTEQKKEDIQNSGEVFLSVSPDDVTKLSWTNGDTTLSFTKDGTWSWDEDAAFPVSEDKVDIRLGLFENFTADFVIENASDLSQYGLDEPTCTIDFSTAEQDYEVVLGGFSTMDSERYVSVGDGNVYLVSTDPYDYFDIGIETMILDDEVPYFDQMAELTFDGAENYTISYDESGKGYSASDCYFTDLDGETLPLDTERVEDYCDNLKYITLSEYASYNVTEDELTAWGLDNPEQIITAEYTMLDEDGNEENGSITLSLGQNQEELAAKEKAEAAGETYDGTVTAYARVGESQIVYILNDTDYETLSSCSYHDLCHQEAMPADFDAIEKIEASIDGKTYTITSEEADKTDDETAPARSYFYGETELDAENLRTKLENLTFTGFDFTDTRDTKEAEFVFTLNNEAYPELTLTLYRYDGESCLAVLNGKAVGLVRRSAAVDLIEVFRSAVL